MDRDLDGDGLEEGGEINVHKTDPLSTKPLVATSCAYQETLLIVRSADAERMVPPGFTPVNGLTREPNTAIVFILYGGCEEEWVVAGVTVEAPRAAPGESTLNAYLLGTFLEDPSQHVGRLAPAPMRRWTRPIDSVGGGGIMIKGESGSSSLAPRTDVSDASLAAAIGENVCAVWPLVGRGPGGAVHEDSGALWVTAAIPMRPFNLVLRTDWSPEETGERIVDIVTRAAAADRQIDFLVGPWCRPHDLDERLAAIGYPRTAELTGMAADLDSVDTSFEVPSDLRLERVASHAQLRMYGDLQAIQWHVPAEYVPRLHELHAHEGFGIDQPAHHFLVMDGSRAVAKGAVVLGAGVAGLYGVYVAPEARGNGLATILTLAAYAQAKKLGYRVGVLHSTPAAVTLYERLGFKRFFQIGVYGPGPAVGK